MCVLSSQEEPPVVLTIQAHPLQDNEHGIWSTDFSGKFNFALHREKRYWLSSSTYEGIAYSLTNPTSRLPCYLYHLS